MKRVHICLRLAALGLVGLIAGCANQSTARGTHQFAPLPPTRVGAEALEPVEPRSVTDLLRDADKAFRAANEAQERGDHEAALRNYTLMLELVVEADLDPAIFYSLREHFDDILETTTQQAMHYERRTPRILGDGDIRAGLGYNEIEIPFPLPERVLVEIEEIQQLYPKNFQKGLDRSQKYLPFIHAELERAGLPKELAMLAMVESQFTPKIVSRAGAGGMWQFMRSTGRRYNLRMDSYVDERYNWQSSTRAAIAYLKDLHDFFGGSWALALSAYNMGEGGLERAIASNGGERNLWKLIETPPASNRIRLETKKFYSKFLASMIVAGNPERYGFQSNPQASEDTVLVPVHAMYALEDLDKDMGYASGTLAQLNPDLLRGVTPPTGEYTVAVPADDRMKFLAALKKAPKLKAGGTHKVRRGETISQIAQHYGVSQSELMRMNNIRSPRSLRTNQTLQIPGFAAGKGGAPSTQRVLAASGSKTYRVQRGDTLYDIAKAHDVSVNDLQRWNSLGRRSRIQVGDRLRVAAVELSEPSKASVETASRPDDPGDVTQHTVRAGEYPAKIARNYGVPLEDLLAWNGLSKNCMIRVGDKLAVKKASRAAVPKASTEAPAAKRADPAPASPPAETEPVTHRVAKGESASVIAQKYGVSTRDFLAWNKLSSKSVLRVGQECVVHHPAGHAQASAPAAPDASSAPAGQISTHIVAKGQNPTTIARRYGVKVSDLFKWNGWPQRHVLQVGDKVIVYKN